MALATLDAWELWPNRKCVLVGPTGAGKTHLAHVWAAKAKALILNASELPGRDIPALATRPIVAEDADRAGADAEEPLFHLHNAMASAGHPLLLTATEPASRWPIGLADLKSRMEATTVAEIKAPDDALLLAVMIKLFADRQLTVPANVPSYVLARLDRSFDAVRRFVDALDQTALQAKSPITRAMAGALLDNDRVSGA